MKSIMFKLWAMITFTNLVVFLLLGLAFGQLIHDFHFGLKAEDLKGIANEINMIYEKSGKEEALKYSLAMARHSGAVIEILDVKNNVLMSTDQNLAANKNIFTLEQLKALNLKKYYVSVNNIDYFKKDMISVITPSPNQQSNTVVFAPVDPITSTIHRLELLILYTGIGIMLLMALVSFFVSRRISSPLLKLNKEALKIADGQFDNLDVPHSHDEIGQLSKTIVYVADNMKKTLAEREQLAKIQKDFIANISHDLRTPLSLIQGYAVALQEGVVEGQEKDQAVQIIIDESERMHRMANELLKLAKLEAGKQEFNFIAVNLNELTQKILENYAYLAEEKQIVIKVLDNATGKSASADYDALAQAIINLLSNAVSHTPQAGKVDIKINSKENQLIYSIHNSGSFINEEDRQFIWERFYKAEKSRSRTEKGTGLGLAIVKGIIIAHQGEVGVSSNVDSGTTFWFTLPQAS